MIFYKNGQNRGFEDILTVRTDFYDSAPDDLTTISGNPSKYCRFWITTSSGIFE